MRYSLPQGWKAVRLKYMCSLSAAYGANEAASSYVDDGVRFLRTSDIREDGSLTPHESGVFLPEDIVRDYLLEAGDLLVSRSGTLGRSYIYDETVGPAAYAGYLVRFRPKTENCPRFLFHFTKTNAFFEQIAEQSIQTTIFNFNGQKYASMEVPLPPAKTQRAIADFLDRKTAAIDELVRKKERLIDLLQEKRQALITQAVTKGLDPNVPMKDSGIEWLGEIPAHWEMHRLRRVVARFVDYRGRTPEKVQDGVALITAGAVRNGMIDHARAPEWVTGEVHQELVKRGRPEVGDLLFTSEAPLGEVGLVVDTRIACAQRIIMFKPERRRIGGEFLRLHFLADSGRGELMTRASGSTAAGIRADRLKMTLVATPPLPEQAAITSHVQVETAGLDQVFASIGSQLEKLHEYRRALISAAVTGQIDIPESPP